MGHLINLVVLEVEVYQPPDCILLKEVSVQHKATLSQVSHPQAITSIQTQSLNMRELHFSLGSRLHQHPEELLLVQKHLPSQLSQDDSFVVGHTGRQAPKPAAPAARTGIVIGISGSGTAVTSRAAPVRPTARTGIVIGTRRRRAVRRFSI